MIFTEKGFSNHARAFFSECVRGKAEKIFMYHILLRLFIASAV